MKRKRVLDLLYTFLPVLSLGLLFLTWFWVSSKNAAYVPTPGMLINRFVELYHHPISGVSIWGDIWASLRRVLIAFGAGIILGISFGILMGWNRKINAFINPVFEILRPIPPIAWIPLVILWFGIGEFPKILLVFIGSFIPIVLNTITGVQLVDPILLNAGRVLGASNRQLLTEVVIPAATPAIFAGLAAALSSGWMIVVAAEMIAANSGLGFLIVRGMEGDDIPLIVLAMILIGLVGAIISYGLQYCEGRLSKWRTN